MIAKTMWPLLLLWLSLVSVSWGQTTSSTTVLGSVGCGYFAIEKNQTHWVARDRNLFPLWTLPLGLLSSDNNCGLWIYNNGQVTKYNWALNAPPTTGITISIPGSFSEFMATENYLGFANSSQVHLFTSSGTFKGFQARLAPNSLWAIGRQNANLYQANNNQIKFRFFDSLSFPSFTKTYGKAGSTTFVKLIGYPYSILTFASTNESLYSLETTETTLVNQILLYNLESQSVGQLPIQFQDATGHDETSNYILSKTGDLYFVSSLYTQPAIQFIPSPVQNATKIVDVSYTFDYSVVAFNETLTNQIRVFCTVGNYLDPSYLSHNGSFCSACPAGTYGIEADLELESRCESCPTGKYSSRPGLTRPSECSACSSGTELFSSASCRACPDNQTSVDGICTDPDRVSYSKVFLGAYLTASMKSNPDGSFIGVSGDYMAAYNVRDRVTSNAYILELPSAAALFANGSAIVVGDTGTQTTLCGRSVSPTNKYALLYTLKDGGVIGCWLHPQPNTTYSAVDVRHVVTMTMYSYLTLAETVVAAGPGFLTRWVLDPQADSYPAYVTTPTNATPIAVVIDDQDFLWLLTPYTLHALNNDGTQIQGFPLPGKALDLQRFWDSVLLLTSQGVYRYQVGLVETIVLFANVSNLVLTPTHLLPRGQDLLVLGTATGAFGKQNVRVARLTKAFGFWQLWKATTFDTNSAQNAMGLMAAPQDTVLVSRWQASNWVVSTLDTCGPGYSGCEPCQPGTKSTDHQTCTPCSPGTHSASNASLVCDSCPQNTYSGQGQSTCTPCPASTFGAPTGSTNVSACNQTCDPGTYSEPGSSSCLPCQGGTYSTGGTACFPCPEYTYSTAGSSSCLDCPIGLYAPPGSASCSPCPDGFHVVLDACEPCQPGSFGIGGVCTPCGRDTYQPLSGQTSCTACPQGTLYNGTGLVNNTCKTCSPGSYVEGLTGSRVCAMCWAGTFSTVGGASELDCLPCPQGSYSHQNASECLACPFGTYGPTPSLESCPKCPAGTFSLVAGATSSTVCQACEAGTYSTEGANTCPQCPVDTFSATNAGTCETCPTGTCTQLSMGSSGCQDCTNWFVLSSSGCVDDCSTLGDTVNVSVSNAASNLTFYVGGVLSPSRVISSLSGSLSGSLYTVSVPVGAGDTTVRAFDSQGSSGSVAISYRSPVVTGFSGCPSMGCNRFGGATVTLTGSDFGPSKPTVLVGGAVAEVLECLVGSVVFKLPAGSGFAVGVNVIQAGGRMSSEARLVTYEACPAGTYNVLNTSLNIFTCSPCAKGYVSLSEEAFSCSLCPANSYCVDSVSVASCETVLPGSLSSPGSHLASNCSCQGARLFQDGLCVCPAGQEEADTVTGCAPCANLFAQPTPSADSCLSCKGWSVFGVSNGDRTSCECMEGYYQVSSGCEVCPPGATCPQGTQGRSWTSNPGYWVASQGADPVECFVPEACPGGNGSCSTGYQGPACAVCEGGYTSENIYEGCGACFQGSHRSSFSVLMAFLGILLATALLGYLRNFRQANDWLVVLSQFFDRSHVRVLVKVLVAYIQIISSLGEVLSVRYPSVYEQMLSVLQLSSLNLSSIFAIHCMARWDFFDSLLLRTLLPISLGCLLTLVYLPSLRREYAVERDRTHVWCDYYGYLFFLGFFFYPGSSSVILQTFHCDHLPGEGWFLRSDYSISCETETYELYRLYAGLMVVLIPVGVPALYLTLLWRQRFWINRKAEEVVEEVGRTPGLMDQDVVRLMNDYNTSGTLVQHDHEDNVVAMERYRKDLGRRLVIAVALLRDDTMPLGSLFEAYRPECWWFDALELFRRLTMTGLLVFMYPGSSRQLTIALLLALGFIIVYTWLHPYLNVSHNRLMMAAQWGVVAQLLGTMMLETSMPYPGLISSLMISAGSIFPLVPLLRSSETRRKLKTWFEKVRDQRQSVGTMRAVSNVVIEEARNYRRYSHSTHESSEKPSPAARRPSDASVSTGSGNSDRVNPLMARSLESFRRHPVTRQTSDRASSVQALEEIELGEP